MDTETAKRYADRVRSEKDQATAALNMLEHVTGHHWVGVWSSLDLARMADEQGGTLTAYDGTTTNTAQWIEATQRNLEDMRAEIDALKTALKATCS